MTEIWINDARIWAMLGPPPPPRLPARIRKALRCWWWRKVYDRRAGRVPPDLKYLWDHALARSLIG